MPNTNGMHVIASHNVRATFYIKYSGKGDATEVIDISEHVKRIFVAFALKTALIL